MPRPRPTKTAKPTRVTRGATKPRESGERRAGRIALVGRPNVGKSTLLNALVGERLAVTSHHPQTTRDRIVGILTDRSAQLVLVDTPGIHAARTRLGTRMNQEAQGAIGGSDVVVFVTDVARAPTTALDAGGRPLAPLGVFDADVPLIAALPDVPLVLVVNKVDRVKEKVLLFPLLEAYGKLRSFAAIVPLSAKKVGDVSGLVTALRELVPLGDPHYAGDTLTDRPTRFFVAELVREQILGKTRAEVPHGVAVTVDRYDESGKTIKMDVSIIVDKDSHKRIVIGRGGSLLKEIGTDARRKIETLVGRKVHLALWVKVIPRWYDSDSRLVELGYGGDRA